MKRKNHRTAFRPIAIGCVLLAAAAAGVWVFVPHENLKRNLGQVLPIAVPDPDPDEAVVPAPVELSDLPVLLLTEGSDIEADQATEELTEAQTAVPESASEEAEKTPADQGREATEPPLPATEDQGAFSSAVSVREPELQDTLTDVLTHGLTRGLNDADSGPDAAGQTGTEDTAAQDDPAAGRACTTLAGNLQAFFDRLDQQEPAQAVRPDRPMAEHLTELTAKLFANPPIVIRESDDLYSILTNTAHFFRVIGKDNILLVKELLEQEQGNIEQVAADLYQWSMTEQCPQGGLHLSIPLADAYEYAGFFLNTMGGRSYLFRRDTRSRLLINYYAVLIVDQANSSRLNAYGIDINSALPWLIREIEATNQLRYKDRYLDRLYTLLEKYSSE